jgi:hypothetical protein
MAQYTHSGVHNLQEIILQAEVPKDITWQQRESSESETISVAIVFFLSASVV